MSVKGRGMTSNSIVRRLALYGATAALGMIGLAGPAMADDAAGPAAMRRLTQEQYRQIIDDVFGPTVTLGGRFEPDVRDAGLLAVGASQVSVTAAGLEQYDRMARSIASQVVDEQHRALLIPCKPASAMALRKRSPLARSRARRSAPSAEPSRSSTASVAAAMPGISVLEKR